MVFTFVRMRSRSAAASPLPYLRTTAQTSAIQPAKHSRPLHYRQATHPPVLELVRVPAHDELRIHALRVAALQRHHFAQHRRGLGRPRHGRVLDDSVGSVGLRGMCRLATELRWM